MLIQYLVSGSRMSRRQTSAGRMLEAVMLLAGLVERGTITPVIDRRFALSETVEAVRRLGYRTHAG